MKKAPHQCKKLIFGLVLLFLLPLISAEENLYSYDSLKLQLEVEGNFDLVPTAEKYSVKEAAVELLLYPQDDFRQQVLEWESSGTKEQNKVNFRWNDGKIGKKEYGYRALVQTKNERLGVQKKVLFPILPVPGMEKYLLPTESIDSDNPEIIARATELAEGEDDLFQVAFKLADWVEENVEYDLNSLTASASQKASWVLKNKEGVCDEMTSLFVAMMRSLGVPARFVSGISYTTSELFAEPWQPHGWAEVYFPEVGWIPFDITFGEYGYIDVTHIKLRDGFDLAEPSSKFEWLSSQVELQSGDISTLVSVSDLGTPVETEVSLEMELLAPEIGFGSYNQVKGVLKNKNDYYLAKTLQLALPSEVEIIGKNKRKILLSPKEVRETYWTVRVPAALKSNFIYTMPVLLYSETNASVQDFFTVKEGNAQYSAQDLGKLSVEEDKSYSRKISFLCSYPLKMRLGSQGYFNCTAKNTGNTNLKQVDFCLNGICEIVDLPINQERAASITIRGESPGRKKAFVSAENEFVEKKAVLEYSVLDDPKLSLDVIYPEKITYGDSFQIKTLLAQESFSIPKNVVVKLAGPAFENQWEMEELPGRQELPLELGTERIGYSTPISIAVSWKDEEGKTFTETKEIKIKGSAENFSGKISLLFNQAVGFLYQLFS